MRCIEIVLKPSARTALAWLTLTWDVLKYLILGEKSGGKSWLTLTWDVLKYRRS